MCAPTRTIVPACMTGQVHDVVSPAGGSAGLRPQTDSMVFTNPTAPWPKRCPRSASEAVRLHSGPVTPAGHGMSGGAGIRARLSGRSGVEAGTVWRTSLARTGLSPSSRL